MSILSKILCALGAIIVLGAVQSGLAYLNISSLTGDIETALSKPIVQIDSARAAWSAYQDANAYLARTQDAIRFQASAESIAKFNELAGQPFVRAHHGSLVRAQRVEIEDLLKAGRLRALVATSSLELGIDMGAIDLVVQIEAPPSVASGLQRIGRAGHSIDAVSSTKTASGNAAENSAGQSLSTPRFENTRPIMKNIRPSIVPAKMRKPTPPWRRWK